MDTGQADGSIHSEGNGGTCTYVKGGGRIRPPHTFTFLPFPPPIPHSLPLSFLSIIISPREGRDIAGYLLRAVCSRDPVLWLQGCLARFIQCPGIGELRGAPQVYKRSVSL